MFQLRPPPLGPRVREAREDPGRVPRVAEPQQRHAGHRRLRHHAPQQGTQYLKQWVTWTFGTNRI